ncbi:MAG: hypothetical protein ACLP1Q_09090 [Solirubrobacteraceae bacterium]|jgi:hypothetical protein
MSIKYTGNDGRSYPDMTSMLRAGFDEALAGTYAEVERAIRMPTCPIHHRKATVQRTRSGSKVQFRVEACCEQLKDEAEASAGRVMKA